MEMACGESCWSSLNSDIAAHALERLYRQIFVPLDKQVEPPPSMRAMIERQYVLKDVKLRANE